MRTATGTRENNPFGAVRVSTSAVNLNLRGIVLRGTGRAIVDHNELSQNSTSGIELDATSSANRIVRNVISGGADDVVDNGSANCWCSNTFSSGSVPPCP